MLRRILLIGVIILVGSLLCLAQETRSTIVGHVTDSSGAAIANAQVLVANQETGVTSTLGSNSDGLYTASLLLPGTYRVSVQVPGFKQFVRENIQLQVADRLEVNATLDVGTQQETVVVSGTPELLSTETASLGTVITSKQIADLPISYGNPFLLIGLSGGTTFTGNPRLDRPFEPTHVVGYSIDGTRSNRSDITLDGSPASATADAGQVIASYVPLTEMLSEFKVQTATFDAAMGNTEGGVTNLSTKYGTNELHGRAYYSITRKQFWANDYFNNLLGRERPDFRFNRWGGVLGGPVFIPKVYNGRNKTFFFVGYEGLNDSRPRYDSATPQVPTPAMKNGDFSALLSPPGGSAYQIYNPYTRRRVGSQFMEDPFPGNRIPVQFWNPVGKAILDRYYPNPTSPGDALGNGNLLRPDLAETSDYYNYSIRLDHSIGEKQRLYGRFSDYNRNSNYNNYFNNLATGTFFQFMSKNVVFDDTVILSPTLVLDVRYGYNRFIRAQDGNPASQGFDLTTLGLPASYNNAIPADIRRFPRIDVTNYIGTATSGEYRPVDTHSLAGSVTKTIGTHSIRGGMEFRAYRENDVFYANDQTGRFIFDSTYTRGPLDNSANSPSSIGQSVAALLLGIPSSSSYVSRAASYAEQSKTWGLYAQDDWKVLPKLTLNIGLRWEFESPLTERFNRSVQDFDPNYVQPFNSAAVAAYTANYSRNPLPVTPAQFGARGGLTFANGGLYNTPKKNLLPRVGFAYQLNAKTVLRGGFGIYQGFLGERRGDVIQSGFSQNTPFVPFAPNGTTLLNTLSNPFPGGIVEPVGAAGGYQTFLGQALTFFNQNPKMPKMSRWQMNIQRQLPGSIVFEVSYVGNKGTAVDLNRNINALPNQYLSTSNVRDNATNTFLTGQVPNPFVGLLPSTAPSSFTSTTIARQQLLLPYPEFGTITTTTNEGYSWYHALQLHADKRFGDGLSVLFNYTFSKFMQATELLNAGDPAPTRMISDQDSPHRFSSSVIYNLPFGRGQRFFPKTNAWVDGVIGGWEVTAIWAMQSGLPLNFGSTTNSATTDYFFANTGGAPQVALPSAQQSIYQWFNTSAFVTANAAQPISHLRVNPYRFSTVRGPRINNVDISVLKDFRIPEGHALRFSAQALNAFNHALLPTPNLTQNNALFGTSYTSSNQGNYPRRLQLELKYSF